MIMVPDGIVKIHSRMPRHSCCEVRVMQLHDILLLCTSTILLEAISHNSNVLIQSDIQITPSGQRFVKADAADHNHLLPESNPIKYRSQYQ